jgi:chromosomal replication initiation ATPase DnaA
MKAEEYKDILNHYMYRFKLEHTDEYHNYIKLKYFYTKNSEITVDNIIKLVCEGEKVDIEDMKRTGRNRNLNIQPRQIASYLITKHIKGLTLESIGKALRNEPLDHATVIHANKTINNLIDTDKRMKNKLIHYEDIIKAWKE